jgi:NhaA family Na+:H+ antiporter
MPFRLPASFQFYFKRVAGGSFPLFATTVLALIWANTSYETYQHFWHTELGVDVGSFSLDKSLAHWIDDALMVLFFFIVGLEIKREILVGELASFKRALLPVAAAIGGMILPALIYMGLNWGLPTFRGWGIPMATDIAFSIAVLAALGKRVPFGVKIFLSAFAIADDLGAVLVIAIFYTAQIQWTYLLAAGGCMVILFILNRMWVREPMAYALVGVGLWICILGSGVHATVAGVILAMFIPARGRYDTDTFVGEVRNGLDRFDGEDGSRGETILLNKTHLNAVHSIEMACHDVATPLQRLQHALQGWVTYLVLPLFAMANAGLVLTGFSLGEALTHPVTLGVTLGLLIGKPVGITLFTFGASKILKAPLVGGVTWLHILGAGILGGIGFTMSLFIDGLSFSKPELVESAKMGIMLASAIAAIVGLSVLWLAGKRADRDKLLSSSAAGE